MNPRHPPLPTTRSTSAPYSSVERLRTLLATSTVLLCLVACDDAPRQACDCADEPSEREAAGTSAEILDRAPDASREEMRELLRSVPVGAGDTLAVPAGTIHAIDEGLVLFEVQQTSDATYRIYDWDRGRPVHLDDAREAAHDLPAEQPSRREPADDTWTPLLDDAREADT